MKKLSFLMVLALVACGSGQSSTSEKADLTAPAVAPSPPAAGQDVVPAASGGKFYREGLSGVDFSGLDAVKKERALKILNAEGCDCGCGMTIAQCRVEDKTCPRSPSLAAAVVNAIRSGATDQQAQAALKAVRDGSGGDAGGVQPAAQPVPAVDLKTDESPSLGPDDAPITLVAFEEFQCPYCARAAPVLKKLVSSNEDVRLVFKHYPLPNHPRARPAAIASVAAQRQGKFWEMHDLLFKNQRALDDASIDRYARSIGLDMEQFARDKADPAVAKHVDDEALEARRAGVTGTPNVFVNGVKSPSWAEGTMQRLIEAARRGGDVSQEAGAIMADLQKRQQAAREAQARRRQAEAGKVYQIDTEGAPFKGPADAPVTIVSFSDYQCPYCARTEPLLKKVREAYPDSVKVVHKHFPLSFHKNARPASEAAIFAMKQGKFWEMHDLLFQNYRSLSLENIKSFGQQVGLDPQALETSITSQSYKSIIDKDVADGRMANVTGTPSLYINGKKLQRRDFATIQRMINEILASEGSGAAAGK